MPIDRMRRSGSSHPEAAMLETIAGSILLAIAVLMFVLAGSGNKRLAVSATNDGVERDLFCQTCMRLPRKHCRRCQTGIWAREWQKNSRGLVCGRKVTDSHSISAMARQQGKSTEFISHRSLADPNDDARAIIDRVRASNKALREAAQIIANTLKRDHSTPD
jgi:hypothetical protein